MLCTPDHITEALGLFLAPGDPPALATMISR
jgi:hypothetical protein